MPPVTTLFSIVSQQACCASPQVVTEHLLIGTQSPSTHSSLSVQAVSQPPQWKRLVCVSTSRPPHMTVVVMSVSVGVSSSVVMVVSAVPVSMMDTVSARVVRPLPESSPQEITQIASDPTIIANRVCFVLNIVFLRCGRCTSLYKFRLFM